METASKNFRPFVYIILAVGAIVAIAVAVIYGQLYEEIDQESSQSTTPAPHEKIEPGQTSP